ncbi:MAG: DUF6268 family outer membrane beta-barrel protein [Bacteroidia bacterium]
MAIKKNILSTLLFLVAGTLGVFAQPYVDIVNTGCQLFSSSYVHVNNTPSQNQTNDYYLNLFFPKQLKNKDVLLFRINAERVDSYSSDSSSNSPSASLYALSVPVGMQILSKNEKWKTTFLAIPKIAGALQNSITAKEFQMGGALLFTYQKNNFLEYKIGLYYNREAFGNFFMPLGAIEWKANKHWKFYGIIPSNYYVEYKCNDKLFFGLNFKAFTRSFQLAASQNNDYVRYNEEELKFYVDYFVYKKLLAFAEAGYNLGKNPIQYNEGTSFYCDTNPIYSPVKNYFLFNFGIAYRLRFDLLETKI